MIKAAVIIVKILNKQRFSIITIEVSRLKKRLTITVSTTDNSDKDEYNILKKLTYTVNKTIIFSTNFLCVELIIL